MIEQDICKRTEPLEAKDNMATKAAKIEALAKKIVERKALMKKHIEGGKEKNSQTLRIDRKLLKRAMRNRKKLILGHKISKKMRKEGTGGEVAPAAKAAPAKAAPAKAAPAAKEAPAKAAPAKAAPADKAAPAAKEAPAAKPAPDTKAAPDAKK
jgi:hypothetical protein